MHGGMLLVHKGQLLRLPGPQCWARFFEQDEASYSNATLSGSYSANRFSAASSFAKTLSLLKLAPRREYPKPA